MDGLLEAVVLGALQGVAEWLPISSQGIVSMTARAIFGRSYGESLEISIWLHLGTMLAAILYFRRDLREILDGFRYPGLGRSLLTFLIISTLSTAVTGLPLLILIRHVMVPDSVTTVSIGFMLALMAFMRRRANLSQDGEATRRKALVTGLAQGLSIVPGISRSGITVIALLCQKLTLTQSLRLSFLMSIPATAAAQLALPVVFSPPTPSPETIASALAATALGLLTIKTLLRISSHRNYTNILATLGALAIVSGIIIWVWGN